MTRTKTAIAAALLALSLSACGAAVEDGEVTPNGGKIYGNVQRVEIDGIDCIIFDADSGGGALSCNWNESLTEPLP